MGNSNEWKKDELHTLGINGMRANVAIGARTVTNRNGGGNAM